MPSAAILTGGKATRFGGRDKSAISVGGRSILDRQLAAVSQVADDIMLVGSSARILEPPGASPRHVPDLHPGEGPLAGLDTALEGARHDPLLLLACDMPFVTAPWLEYLLALAREVSAPAEPWAVVPRTGGDYHPLCAAYTAPCRTDVRKLLAEGRRSMRDLLGLVRVRVVEGEELLAFGDPGVLLTNVNTAAALDAIERAEQLQGHET